MKFYNSGSREPQSYTAKATKKVTQIPNKKKSTHTSHKKNEEKTREQTKVVTASENSKKIK